MGNRRPAILGFLAGVAACATVAHGLAPAEANPFSGLRQLGLFGDIYDRVRTSYVEKPDDAKMMEGAVNGMLATLDPHSQYLPPKAWQESQSQTRGEFGGLGIEVTLQDGLVKVVSPIDDTPASRAGLQGSDLVTKVDGDAVLGMTLAQAVERMRGAPGSKVVLTVLRGEGKKAFDVSLVREVIRVRPVKARLEGDVGYLRVTQFNERTGPDLKAAMEKLSKDAGADRLKGYVLDMRNNPGGLVDQAVAVTQAFIGHGTVVTLRGRDEADRQAFEAEGPDLSDGKPVAVLVNGGTASAAEIVAGALQDYHRATLLGTRTFGKGSVQSMIPLGSQGALKLTTARYYTPSGRSIQARGIDPDVTVREDVPEDLKGRDEIAGEAGLKGHLANGKDAKGGSSAYVPQDPRKDKALHAALRLVRSGKAVPADTADGQAEATVPEPAGAE